MLDLLGKDAGLRAYTYLSLVHKPGPSPWVVTMVWQDSQGKRAWQWQVSNVQSCFQWWVEVVPPARHSWNWPKEWSIIGRQLPISCQPQQLKSFSVFSVFQSISLTFIRPDDQTIALDVLLSLGPPMSARSDLMVPSRGCQTIPATLTDLSHRGSTLSACEG